MTLDEYDYDSVCIFLDKFMDHVIEKNDKIGFIISVAEPSNKKIKTLSSFSSRRTLDLLAVATLTILPDKVVQKIEEEIAKGRHDDKERI
ncbi:MAG: hypothetical protein ACC657_05545 [Thiohalomonadales bacterium]